MGDKNGKKGGVSFAGSMSRDQLLAYLEEFTRSVRAGAVQVEGEDSTVVLSPGEVVKLEVKARSKAERQSVRLELSWSERGLEIGS